MTKEAFSKQPCKAPRHLFTSGDLEGGGQPIAKLTHRLASGKFRHRRQLKETDTAG